MTLTQEPLHHHHHHHHQKAREIPHWKKFPKISLHLPPGFADQEFEDFFIASEDPDVTMTTTQPQSKPHPPQPSVGFGDSFSDHPLSAFTSEVTSDVIPVGDQGIPPVCSPDPLILVPLILCTERLPHHSPIPLPNLKMKMRTLPPQELPSLTPGSCPKPVHLAVTKQTHSGDQQGVQYHSSSPWQQGADCFGAIPFVSVATKDN